MNVSKMCGIRAIVIGRRNTGIRLGHVVGVAPQGVLVMFSPLYKEASSVIPCSAKILGQGVSCRTLASPLIRLLKLHQCAESPRMPGAAVSGVHNRTQSSLTIVDRHIEIEITHNLEYDLVRGSHPTSSNARTSTLLPYSLTSKNTPTTRSSSSVPSLRCTQ